MPGDLDDLDAGGVVQLPGMGPGAQPHFDRHHNRVARIRDAARDYREEAADVLGQFSDNVSDRLGIPAFIPSGKPAAQPGPAASDQTNAEANPATGP